MHTAKEKLPVFYGAERILQIHVAAPDGFDLRSGKLDAGFKTFEHKVFMKRLAVAGNLLYALLFRRHLFHFPSVVKIILPHRKGK